MSIWKSDGTQRDSILNITTNYTATINDGSIFVDATLGQITIILPPAISSTGLPFNIKKIDSTNNKVIIDASGSEEIDDELTFEILSQHESVTVKSDGNEYFIQ